MNNSNSVHVNDSNELSRTKDEETFAPFNSITPRDHLGIGECVGEGGYGQAEFLSRIRHPNIIQFYGVSEVDLGYLIVTEYAEGGSLYMAFHNAKDSRFDFKQIITWAWQIASGVAYLRHDASVKTIHRDLKSLNFILSDELVCKMCDFRGSKNPTHSVRATFSVDEVNSIGRLAVNSGHICIKLIAYSKLENHYRTSS
ncbi:unnamed protein product [Anisakis simplex]|uniref:Protein kinase domain-containing protein n=1 Tax=Anisakis simplex TaxID=6269 RepID=A0A0M3K572_ANISI|nr:unnamed protein product [Anisakis simplex]